jgi:hypothetical protein
MQAGAVGCALRYLKMTYNCTSLSGHNSKGDVYGPGLGPKGLAIPYAKQHKQAERVDAAAAGTLRSQRKYCKRLPLQLCTGCHGQHQHFFGLPQQQQQQQHKEQQQRQLLLRPYALYDGDAAVYFL